MPEAENGELDCDDPDDFHDDPDAWEDYAEDDSDEDED